MNLAYFSADLRDDWQRTLSLADLVSTVAREQGLLCERLRRPLLELLHGWQKICASYSEDFEETIEIRDRESLVFSFTLLAVLSSCARWSCASHGLSSPLASSNSCHSLYSDTASFLMRAYNLCAHAPSESARFFSNLPSDVRELINLFLGEPA